MAGRPSVVPAHVYNPGLYASAAPALGLGASGHTPSWLGASLGGTSTSFGAPAASRATGPVGAPAGGPYGNPALGAQPMPAGHGAPRAGYASLAGAFGAAPASTAYTGMRATRGVGKPAGYWAGTSGGRRKSRRHRKKSRKTRRRY